MYKEIEITLTNKVRLLGEVEDCHNGTYKIEAIVVAYNKLEWPNNFILERAETITFGEYLDCIHLVFSYQGSLNVIDISE